jgi:hypothetical protein
VRYVDASLNQTFYWVYTYWLDLSGMPSIIDHCISLRVPFGPDVPCATDVLQEIGPGRALYSAGQDASGLDSFAFSWGCLLPGETTEPFELVAPPLTSIGTNTVTVVDLVTDPTTQRVSATNVVSVPAYTPQPPQGAVSPGMLVNGHFEFPAMSGDGQIWSSDPAFSLPGWAYPTGTNQCYLEFGHPTGTARYVDGRQTLCLHGQGTPASISQTFPTVPSMNYTLSFSQADENNAGPSASQLTVGLPWMSPRVTGNWGTYHQYDDHGYVPQVMNFTAWSNSTTLTFTDTSPAGAPSPLIDGVCVNPGSGLVMRSGMPIPGHLTGFSILGVPTVSADLNHYSVAYVGTASAAYRAIVYGDGYCSNGIPHIGTNPPGPGFVADTATAIPGGAGTFSIFSPGSLVELNPQPLPPGRTRQLLFWAGGSGGQQGFYTSTNSGSGPAGSPQVMADTHTGIPNHTSQTFANFISSSNSLTAQVASDGNNVVLWGAGADGWDGVYCATVPHVGPTSPPPQLSVVADRTTVLPGGGDSFVTFVNANSGAALWPPNHLAIGDNTVVLYGASVGGVQGLYGAPVPPAGGASPYVVRLVDTTMSPPNGCCNFTGFGTFDVASALGRLNVAFVGLGPGGQQAIYDEDGPICPPTLPIPLPLPGPIRTVADTNTAIPQGVGNFTGFAGVACGGPYGISLAFVGLGANGQKGIYTRPAPSPAGVFPFRLAKVIDLSDTLDGKTIADLQLAPGGLQGYTLAYKAVFTDGTQAICTIPVIDNVMIHSMSIVNNDIHFFFGAPAGRNYWVLSGSALDMWDTNSVVNVPGSGAMAEFLVIGGFNPFDGRTFQTVRASGESPDLYQPPHLHP